MKRNAFTFSSGEKRRNADSFERSRRSRAGSTRSYTEGVHKPTLDKEIIRDLCVLAGITLILPPVGIAVLWRRGLFQLPVRIGATALAFLLMVLYFGWMIPEDEPAVYQPPIQRPSAVTEYATPQTQTTQTGTDEALPLY